MAFDLGGGSKTSQTQNQLQVAAAQGPAFGGAVGKGAIGSGGSGNITGGIRVLGGAVSVVNTTTDYGAIATSNELSLQSLKSMQDLSTLAVGYANQNSNQALQALQTIGTQAQVSAAGGSPAEVAGALTTTPGTVGFFDTKTMIAIGALILGAFLIYKFR